MCAATLEELEPVSVETECEMALGFRRTTSTALGVGTTGLANPEVVRTRSSWVRWRLHSPPKSSWTARPPASTSSGSPASHSISSPPGWCATGRAGICPVLIRFPHSSACVGAKKG